MKFEVIQSYLIPMMLKSALATPKLDRKIVPFARQSDSQFWQGRARASKVCLAYGEANRNRWITLCVIHRIMREQSLSTKMPYISRAPELIFERPTIRYAKITPA